MTVIALDFNPNDGKNRDHKRTCCHNKSDGRTSSVCDILSCKKRFRVLNRRGQCCSSKFPAWNGYNQKSAIAAIIMAIPTPLKNNSVATPARASILSFLLLFSLIWYSPFILLCLLVYFQYWKNGILIFAKNLRQTTLV